MSRLQVPNKMLLNPVPPGGAAGQVLAKSSSVDYAMSWVNQSSGGGGITLPLTQHLTFAADNTYDVGQDAARPRRLYAASELRVGFQGSDLYLSDSALSAPSSLGLSAGGTGSLNLQTNFGSTRWYLPQAGHLLAASDNTLDIGAAAANRPRDLFLGRNALIGGNLTVTGTIAGNGAIPSGGTTGQALFKGSNTNYDVGWGTPFSQTTADTRYLQLTGGTLTGNLLFSTDSTRDIGASGATRPRDLFLGRNLNVGGTVGYATAPIANAGIYGAWTALSGSSQYAEYLQPTFTSTATTMSAVLQLEFRTQSTTFGMGSGYQLRVAGPIVGAGNTITDMFGINVANQGGTGRTNAFGVYIANQTGAATTNVGLRNDGTTHLALKTGIGGAPSTGTEALKVTGDAWFTGVNGFGTNPQGGTALTVGGTGYSHGMWSTTGLQPAGNGWQIDQVRVSGSMTNPGAFTGVEYRSFVIDPYNVPGGTAANYGLLIGAAGGATINYSLRNDGTSWLQGQIDIGTPVGGRLYVAAGSTPALILKNDTFSSAITQVSGQMQASLTANAYWTGTGWARIASNTATTLDLSYSQLTLYKAPSAGAATPPSFAPWLNITDNEVKLTGQVDIALISAQGKAPSGGGGFQAYNGANGARGLFWNDGSSVQVAADGSTSLPLKLLAAGGIELNSGPSGPMTFGPGNGMATFNCNQISMYGDCIMTRRGPATINMPAIGINGDNVGTNSVLFSCHANIYAGIYYSTSGQFLTWPSEGRFKAQQAALPDPLRLLDRAAISYRQPSVAWVDGEALVAQDEAGVMQWGFRADDWRDVPELVAPGPAGIDSFNLSAMIPLTWEAVRALYAEVATLKLRVKELENA